MRDNFPLNTSKDRDGACRDELVIRIPTEDFRFLLLQNADGKDVGWSKATMPINAFFRLDNGYFYGCGVQGKARDFLGGVIDQFGIPMARIAVLDHQEGRGTEQGTGHTERVQEA